MDVKEGNYSLLKYSYELASKINDNTSSEEKKERGQYFTSQNIAKLMASLTKLNKKELKILDPGSGVGILIAAIVERVMDKDLEINLKADLYESDSKLIPLLEDNMNKCKEAMAEKGNSFEYNLINSDFILDHEWLFNGEDMEPELYDLIISNPPYFKVNKQDEYARILKDFIYGQPNVYFMFMVISEKLVCNEGQLIFITPRSYTSGAYFEKFREFFFKSIDPEQFHLFASRKGNFEGEVILQENIILNGYKRKEFNPFVTISTSGLGDDYTEQIYDKKLIIDSSDQVNLIRLPLGKEDEEILNLVDSWPNNLTTMNMNISTGPVVSFRNKESIEPYSDISDIPLINSRNIKEGKVYYPISEKDQSMNDNALNTNILLPSKNYVLVKRFTTKEQKRRVDAGVYLKDEFNFQQIGVDNKVNYLYKNGQSLEKTEALGLTLILNSELIDKYFRAVNGNTQVNASDIRPLPLPEFEFIIELGMRIQSEKYGLDGEGFNLKEEYETYLSNIKEGNVGREFEEMSNEDQALEVLEAVGLPKKQQNRRSALTLLALLNIKPHDEWSNAKRSLLGIRGMMDFMRDNYDQEYAENTRESIRRQTVHQFEQALIISKNPDDPTRPVNSGKTVYGVTDEFLSLIRTWGTLEWHSKLEDFNDQFPSLNEKYEQKREVNRIPININGIPYKLSAGDHNVLQKNIIEDFGSIFAPGSELLYLGDTENKYLHIDTEKLQLLNIPPLSHEKLPDVVLYDPDRNWIFLVEAVTSHGPISMKRIHELEAMLKNCTAGKIYVTAFPDMSVYKKYANDIAWETEVWFADAPEHMMHLNGDRFLGPR